MPCCCAVANKPAAWPGRLCTVFHHARPATALILHPATHLRLTIRCPCPTCSCPARQRAPGLGRRREPHRLLGHWRASGGLPWLQPGYGCAGLLAGRGHLCGAAGAGAGRPGGPLGLAGRGAQGSGQAGQRHLCCGWGALAAGAHKLVQGDSIRVEARAGQRWACSLGGCSCLVAACADLGSSGWVHAVARLQAPGLPGAWPAAVCLLAWQAPCCHHLTLQSCSEVFRNVGGCCSLRCNWMDAGLLSGINPCSGA